MTDAERGGKIMKWRRISMGGILALLLALSGSGVALAQVPISPASLCGGACQPHQSVRFVGDPFPALWPALVFHWSHIPMGGQGRVDIPWQRAADTIWLSSLMAHQPLGFWIWQLWHHPVGGLGRVYLPAQRAADRFWYDPVP